MKTGILVSFLVLLGLPTSIFAQGVLYQHLGANNPVDEGFTLVTSGSGGTVSPVLNDGGVAAWATQVGAGGTLWYSGQLGSTAVAQSDWILSVGMRVLQSGPSFENSFVGVRTSAYIYNLWFAAQADGDPLVRAGAFATGPVFVLEGAGAGYHDYQLRYSHAAGSAELWVDGVMRLSGITSSGQSGISVLQWGDGQAGPSLAHWNEVSFQVVPEPSSLCLLFGGLLLIAVKCRTMRCSSNGGGPSRLQSARLVAAVAGSLGALAPPRLITTVSHFAPSTKPSASPPTPPALH